MSETSDWKLVVVEGQDLGRQFTLGRTSVTIGRGKCDDFIVFDPCVTRQQLTIEWHDATNSHYVSQTGDSVTAFNNIPASRNAGVRHQLCEGDQLQIGSTILVYSRNTSDLKTRR